MSNVPNHIQNRRVPSILVFASITLALVVALLLLEAGERNYELYLSQENCPLLKSAGLQVSWSEPEGCRYRGPARPMLSNWKIENLIIHDSAVIAFRKVMP